MKKTCSKCKNRKPVEKFHRDSTSQDGYSSACGECRNRFRNREPGKGKKSTLTTRSVSRKAAPLVFSDKKPVKTPPPEPVRMPEDDLTRAAKQLALVRLVKNHRQEYDTLIHRAKIQLKLPDKVK